MRLFRKIGIIGVGLIGGSLALAIKKKGLAEQIIGVSRSRKTILLAKKKKAIDIGGQDLSIVKDVDFLILAAPINTILSLAPRLSRIIDRHCIVTDVGSTKKELVSSLRQIFPNYIGSHPLAGSEKRGIIHARADLFKGSLCILTPGKKNNKKILAKLISFWRRVGSRTILMSPEKHDRALSFISHLPHIIAFSLIETVPGRELRLASGGLKDTTRIAASDSEIWADIFMSNRKYTVCAIKSFEKKLAKIKKAIQQKDKRGLNKILIRAKEKRETLA